MLAGKKVAGILVQASGANAIAGIGINVNHTSFPPNWRPMPLRCASTPAHRRKLLSTGIPLTPAAGHRRFRGTRHDNRPSCGCSPKRFELRRRPARHGRSPMASIEGTTAGLDPAGFLIVRRDDGTDTLIVAGGVRAAGS
jgi:biotin-(acetyl-CoA carboxylase) ligase